MNLSAAEDRRTREKGALVYPVYSRRSGGLSVGINLFPDRKTCTFDCPYCEVFPFAGAQAFSLSLMENALADALAGARRQGIPVRDICFSGNGEPTISPHFPAALEAAFRAAVNIDLVLITNGTGLLRDETFELLCRAGERGLRIWLKLDAGTPLWYQAMARCNIPFEQLTAKIRAFVKRAPVTLQTMICAVNGEPPPAEDARAWESLATELACSAAELREVQIYGKARPAPEDPLASALPAAFLEERAASLRAVLTAAGKETPVKVYL